MDEEADSHVSDFLYMKVEKRKQNFLMVVSQSWYREREQASSPIGRRRTGPCAASQRDLLFC